MKKRTAIVVAAVVLLATCAVATWWLFRANPSPPPTKARVAPTNVRVVQSATTLEQWIRWDDNSGDEAGFRGSVRLLQDDAVIALSLFNLPPPGVAQSPAPGFGTQAGEGCYDALISVEAVMTDGSLVPAEDAAVTVCIDEGSLPQYRPFEAVPEDLVFPSVAPGEMRADIERVSDGLYRLAFQGAATAEWIMVTSCTYAGSGYVIDERELPVVSGATASIDLQAGEGLPTAGCFEREYILWTIREALLRGWSVIRQPICLADGVTSSPDIDEPNTPPPAATSDVQVLTGSDGAWRIAWRDNSTDETGFPVLVSVTEEDGDFVMQQGALAAADETSVAFPLEVLALPVGCYRTTIYVFSERLATAGGIPGNAVLRMCIGSDGTTFEPAG